MFTIRRVEGMGGWLTVHGRCKAPRPLHAARRDDDLWELLRLQMNPQGDRLWISSYQAAGGLLAYDDAGQTAEPGRRSKVATSGCILDDGAFSRATTDGVLRSSGGDETVASVAHRLRTCSSGTPHRRRTARRSSIPPQFARSLPKGGRFPIVGMHQATPGQASRTSCTWDVATRRHVPQCAASGRIKRMAAADGQMFAVSMFDTAAARTINSITVGRPRAPLATARAWRHRKSWRAAAHAARRLDHGVQSR